VKNFAFCSALQDNGRVRNDRIVFISLAVTESLAAALPATAGELTEAAGKRLLISNPLWSVPIDGLVASRQRPLFSPIRRPPPPAFARPAIAPVVAPPPKLQLLLVGTVVGEQEGIGVFVELTTKLVFRLKKGEAHDGWVLTSVQQRKVSFEKDGATVTVELPSAVPALPQPESSPGRFLRRVSINPS
jgi:general secretion pathway protein N